MRLFATILFVVLFSFSCSSESSDSSTSPGSTGDGVRLKEAWTSGARAFGVFIPAPHQMFDASRESYPTIETADAAEALGRNEQLDFLFLRMDGFYDLAVVDEIVEGLSRLDSSERPTFLVGIDRENDEFARQQVEEVIKHGVDGVVIPYIKSAEDVALAVSFFEDAGADVWSPGNPDGKLISMFMIETAEGLVNAQSIAAAGGYSALACGVGSLGGELGDPMAAEEGCAMIKELSDTAGLPSMMTVFNTAMLEQRLDQDYRWIMTLMNDATFDIIAAGEAASRF